MKYSYKLAGWGLCNTYMKPNRHGGLSIKPCTLIMFTDSNPPRCRRQGCSKKNKKNSDKDKKVETEKKRFFSLVGKI